MSDQPARSSKAPAALRLLVVDDNDDNRNLLSRRLKSTGYDVDIAVDGPSALEACEKNVYDAIVLDVMMPGMSGVEVLTKLREKRGKTELAVIMATAKNDSTSVVDALKKGANDYVTKPIDFPILLARLETHLAMKAEATERARAQQVDVTFGIAPGTVFCNRYEIIEKRGEGGFAVVYRARQLSTNRDVALKHLRPDVLAAATDRVQLERFERESKLIGELNHPNVVRLIDSGTIAIRRVDTPVARSDGAASTRNESPVAEASRTRRRPPEDEMLHVPFIVMELLVGEPLSELIEREAPLDTQRAVDLILPVLSALSAAHERGVVHRDIKPSNIMLTSDDRGAIEPKVLDFGIAKLTAQAEADLTVSASLIGTPQFMPPEQALGRDIDGRADQFSAAAVLYATLTKKTLYSGETLLELVGKVLSGKFTPLSELRTDLPQDLLEVIGQALSTERDARHPSMAAFARGLLPYASDRVARQWSDHFSIDRLPTASMAPRTKKETSAPMALAPTLMSAEGTEDEPSSPSASAPTVTTKIEVPPAARGSDPDLLDPMADTRPEPGASKK